MVWADAQDADRPCLLELFCCAHPHGWEHDMSNPHRIEVIDPESTLTSGVRIVCDAPVGAPCRMWCDELECEEGASEEHDSHTLRDQGYCARTEGWFDDFPADCYDGDVLALDALHAGPVIITWNGDWMVWSYDTEPTEP